MARRRKIRRRKNKTLKRYKKNEAYVKGLVFEAVLQRLIEKAGFSKDTYFGQYNSKKTKLKGRGGTHQIDVMGIFKLGIPFINPLLLFAEAKNFDRKVGIKEAREFLGTYTDIMQFRRLHLSLFNSSRYSAIFEPTVTYCPVFFSMKGFKKSAVGFMFVHGINYFSYENSEIMNRIKKMVNSVLRQIKFSKLITTDFPIFKNVETFTQLRSECKRNDYDKAGKRISDYLLTISSYVGVLDRSFPVHILTNKTNTPKGRTIKLIKKNMNEFEIKSEGGRTYGKFCLDTWFLDEYISFARKKGIEGNILRQIDIAVKKGDNVNLLHLTINDYSRQELLGSQSV